MTVYSQKTHNRARPVLYAMLKAVLKSILESASFFGYVSFFGALSYSLVIGQTLFAYDDPYIMGFAVACISSFGLLVFLLLSGIRIKWLPPKTVLGIYYLSLTAYGAFLEAVGGEGAGYGYLLIIALAGSLLLLILFLQFRRNKGVYISGYVLGCLYLIGYGIVLFNYI